MMRPARILLLLLAVLAIAQLAAFAPRLPDPMASHFDLAGRADGWMPRATFLGFYVVTVIGLTALVLGIGWLARRAPDTMLNIPNRERWLSREHRAETLDFIGRQHEWIAVAIFGCFVALFQLTVVANARTPAHLPAGATWVLLLGTVAGASIPALRIRRRFSRLPSPARPTHHS